MQVNPKRQKADQVCLGMKIGIGTERVCDNCVNMAFSLS